MGENRHLLTDMKLFVKIYTKQIDKKISSVIILLGNDK